MTTFQGFEPRCTLSNILYGIMYRFRAIAYNDAGPSEPGDPSDPVVIDVPGVQIAPYFVLMLNDTIALEHERVEFKVKIFWNRCPLLYFDNTVLEFGGGGEPIPIGWPQHRKKCQSNVHFWSNLYVIKCYSQF